MRLLFLFLTLLMSGAVHAAACDPLQSISLSTKVHYVSDSSLSFASDASWIETSLTNSEMRSDLASTEELLVNAGIDVEFVADTLIANRVPDQAATEVMTQIRRIFLGIQPSQATEDLMEALQSVGSYDTNVLNIYFIPDKDIRGLHLRDIDGRSLGVVIYGQGGKVDSLAHEMGHAFSLQHVNFWDANHPQVEYCAEWNYFDNVCDFKKDNLMWAGGEERTALHAGQRDRAVCNANSEAARDVVNPWSKVCGEYSIENSGGVQCPPVQ